jgi:hypothetical protein
MAIPLQMECIFPLTVGRCNVERGAAFAAKRIFKE